MWNNLKTTVLLAGLTGLLLAFGQLWGGQRGMMFALVLAGVMNLGSYFFSDKLALAMSGRKGNCCRLSRCRACHRAGLVSCSSRWTR